MPTDDPVPGRRKYLKFSDLFFEERRTSGGWLCRCVRISRHKRVNLTHPWRHASPVTTSCATFPADPAICRAGRRFTARHSKALFGAEDQLVDSQRIVTENLVTLYKALGGGWETTLLAQAEGRSQ